MNKITKKSFYSFLTLYLLSSFIFLFLASYWFYSSQKAIEIQNNYYKMNYIADKVSSQVIQAHMMDEKFKLEKFPNDSVALYDSNQKLVYGKNIQEVDFNKNYYMQDDIFSLISKRTNGHLNIDYVVVQSNTCTKNVMKLRNSVIVTSVFIGVLIIMISVILSYMFLRPIKDKMHEIEEFVKNTTHELNTPITALMMSTSRARDKKSYDEKIIQNISISTKQLYDIYSSLSFLSFDTQNEETVEINFTSAVEESLKYFDELLEKKNIKVKFNADTCYLTIAPTKAKMLINNILSNAIKYSLPNKKIYITIKKNSFIVKDEGIGIARDKLNTIFQRFTRANSYAGGFGVGLNIVYTITKEYGYMVYVDSIEAKGTEVSIIFN